MTERPNFQKFSKIPRLSRDMIITEKIDGTNAQIYITEDGEIYAGSRKRWLTPDKDNFGFAAWVNEHRTELITGLGPGRHYGEWWGKGIQRNYGLNERRFSLFNVQRWTPYNTNIEHILAEHPEWARCQLAPACCHIVPVLYSGSFNTAICAGVLDTLLRGTGSCAAPGFMHSEGIVICHVPSGYLFKKTFENDDGGKNQ